MSEPVTLDSVQCFSHINMNFIQDYSVVSGSGYCPFRKQSTDYYWPIDFNWCPAVAAAVVDDDVAAAVAADASAAAAADDDDV